MRRCAIVFAFLSASGASIAGEYPIAGVTPDRRPETAPKTAEFVRSSDWERRFFFGVAEPRPESLAWSAHQGGWYTPFDRPGAAGPYDLRNWHKPKGKQK